MLRGIARLSARRNGGFTLVEMIVVLAIIGLFAGLTVPTILAYRARRGQDLGDAAVMLRATLRAARAYAIAKHVRAGVFYKPDAVPARDRTRYFIAYESADKVWQRVHGSFGRDYVMPAGTRARMSPAIIPNWDVHLPVGASVKWLTTEDNPVRLDDLQMSPDLLEEAHSPRELALFPLPGLPGHVFDPTGTLDIPGAIKAVVRLEDTVPGEVRRPINVEILRATGQVRVRTAG